MNIISEYREDMGACIYRKGYKLHRPNGPAMIWDGGEYSWWLFDNIHRYYGPQEDEGRWYIHGEPVR